MCTGWQHARQQGDGVLACAHCYCFTAWCYSQHMTQGLQAQSCMGERVVDKCCSFCALDAV